MSLGLRSFIEGSAIRIEATILDFDSPLPPDENVVYLDPDSNQVELYDNDGSLQDTFTDAIVHDDVGIFHLDINLADYTSGEAPTGEKGVWHADWIATTGGLPSKGRIKFNVTK